MISASDAAEQHEGKGGDDVPEADDRVVDVGEVAPAFGMCPRRLEPLDLCLGAIVRAISEAP